MSVVLKCAEKCLPEHDGVTVLYYFYDHTTLERKIREKSREY